MEQTTVQGGGRIKTLNRVKGFGFIAAEDSRGTVFFHLTDQVEPEDMLTEGDVVRFVLGLDESNRLRAYQLQRMRSVY
jgi:cold shock CspA family protein